MYLTSLTPRKNLRRQVMGMTSVYVLLRFLDEHFKDTPAGKQKFAFVPFGAG